MLQKTAESEPSLTPLDGARGRAWWADRAFTTTDAESAARMLGIGRPLDFVALEGTLTSVTSRNPRPDAQRAPAIAIDVDRPGRFDARVTASAEGWLVVTEVFYPGWRAMVNGAPVDVRRAFGSLQAVAVPAGASLVTLRYEPQTLRAAAWAGGVGLALVAGLFVAGRRRTERDGVRADTLP